MARIGDLFKRALIVASALTIGPSLWAQLLFKPAAPMEPNLSGSGILLGDLDGDSHLDAVLPSLSAPQLGGVLMVRGRGDGSFGAPGLVNMPSPGLTILPQALADFDRDGRLDLVSAQDPQGSTFSVRPGDGAGGFGTPTSFDITVVASLASVGDFNGDQFLDIAMLGALAASPLGVAAVALGRGDGTFLPLQFLDGVLDLSDSPLLRVGDVTGDGLDDLVYLNRSDSQADVTFISMGNGTFLRVDCQGNCPFEPASDFVLADVDGDSRADVVTVDGVRLSRGDGTYVLGTSFDVQGFGVQVGVHDLDGDAVLDVVVGTKRKDPSLFPDSTDGDLVFFRGIGNGQFERQVVVSHVSQPKEGLGVDFNSIRFGDLDEDDSPDVVVPDFGATSGPTVVVNHTYAPNSPFEDLGKSLSGTHGYPVLLAEGTLLPGQPFKFSILNSVPFGFTFIVAGFFELNASFRGGTMVPSTDAIFGPVQLDPLGNHVVTGTWPSVGSGATLYLQFWPPDPGGIQGFTSTSGLKIDIP